MNTILKPVKDWAQYDEAARGLNKKQNVLITGCIESQKINMMESLCDDDRVMAKNRLILTYSQQRVREICEDLKLYERNVRIFPGKDLIFYQADIHGNKLTTDRMAVIRRLISGSATTVVTTFDAIMTHMVPKEYYESYIIHIGKGDTVSEKELITSLTDMGYERLPQVEDRGQFSVRGGIIDIFDPTQDSPYRIELWGEDVESVRSFDIDSQRSYEILQNIEVYPATELVMSADMLSRGLKAIEKDAKRVSDKLRKDFKTEEAHRVDVTFKNLKDDITEFGRIRNLESYIDYFYDRTALFTDYFDPDDTLIVIDEPARVSEHIQAVEYEFDESMKSRLLLGYILPGQTGILSGSKVALKACERFAGLMLSTMDDRNRLCKPDIKVNITAKSVAPYKGHFDILLKDLVRYRKNGFKVVVISGSRTRAERLSSDLRDNDIAAIYSDDPYRELVPGEALCMQGSLRSGFEYPMLKFVVISESDIFGSLEKKKRNRQKYKGQKITDFGELKAGDYVVHVDHGIGIYKGIEKVEAGGVTKDYMKIEYKDGGIL